MHHLVYTSTANLNLTEGELLRLLNHWRETNAALDVTGLLLYSEGHIMQVLEGPADHVRKLYDVIAADGRHRAIFKLADGPINARAFAGWSMHFRSVNTEDFTQLVQQMSTVTDHGRELAPLLSAFVEPRPW